MKRGAFILKASLFICIIVDLKPNLSHLQSFLQCSLVQYVPTCLGTYVKRRIQRLFVLKLLSHSLLLPQRYQSSDHQLQHIVLNQAHVFCCLQQHTCTWFTAFTTITVFVRTYVYIIKAESF